MLDNAEMRALDATAQADLVRRREVGQQELVEAAIKAIEQMDPQLNVVVTRMFDQALETARRPPANGPFAGVPFLLKDLLTACAGVPLTSGSRLMQSNLPDYDSELVRRLKGAGLIIVGKTNTPEFGLQPTTEPTLFGPTRNPWDRARTAGGSSGGAAAAVAAGMVPAAHASDGGGSIRIPASCCGVFGLKPTRGRNPLGPDFGDVLNGLVVEHVVSRSVRDSAALLDVLAGPDIGDPYWAPVPARPFAQEIGADPGRLRIGLTRGIPGGPETHPDCISAVEDAAALCEDLGHHVEEACPAFDFHAANHLFVDIWAAGCASILESFALTTGRQPSPDEVEPLTWALYEWGKRLSAPELLIRIRGLQRLAREIAGFFVEHDIWLTPTLAEPPPPLGTFAPAPGDPLKGFFRAVGFTPFTPLVNVTGQPAMSVPLFWNSAGLPIGTQFVGRYGEEATLFRLATQLEQARSWSGRWPSVSAG